MYGVESTEVTMAEHTYYGTQSAAYSGLVQVKCDVLCVVWWLKWL